MNKWLTSQISVAPTMTRAKFTEAMFLTLRAQAKQTKVSVIRCINISLALNRWKLTIRSISPNRGIVSWGLGSYLAQVWDFRRFWMEAKLRFHDSSPLRAEFRNCLGPRILHRLDHLEELYQIWAEWPQWPTETKQLATIKLQQPPLWAGSAGRHQAWEEHLYKEQEVLYKLRPTLKFSSFKILKPNNQQLSQP